MYKIKINLKTWLWALPDVSLGYVTIPSANKDRSFFNDNPVFVYYRAHHVTSAILEKDRELMQKEEEVGN